MTTSTETTPENKLSDRIVNVLGGIALAAVLAGGAAVIQVERLTVRLEQLERDRPALLTVGTQLGELTASMRTVKESIGDLREDVRGLRRTSPPAEAKR